MSISDTLKAKIRQAAGNRCGYCQSPQKYVFAPLEIEHIHPIAKGGDDEEENLWLACRMCNSFKSDNSHGQDPLTVKLLPCSIHVNKSGRNISRGAKMEVRLKA